MMHDTTRNYIRQMLQARLEELTHRMAGFATDSIHEFAQAAEEIRIVANSIADLMTHHVDVPQPAATEQPREMRAALHLYTNVLKAADTIRDMEVRLGLSDQANSKPHNLLRDITQFIDGEKRHTIAEAVLAMPEPPRNGNGNKRRPIITENLG